MGRKGRRIIFLLLLSLVFIQTLFSVITATYVPAPYFFLKRGNEVSVLPNTPLGTFSSNKMVIYLGTITIIKDPGDKYYRPLLVNYFSQSNIYLTGPLRGWSSDQSLFQAQAKNSMQSAPNQIWLSNNETPLYEWSNAEITDNPYIVDLFLVSHHDASLYYEDETYSMPAGSLGSFNIRVARQSNLSESSFEYISINNQTVPTGGGPPDDPIPIPEPGPGLPFPDIPIGEPSPPLMFQINIIDNSPFILSQAYGNTGVKVATIDVSVVNGEVGQSYGIEIKFTNPQNATTFSLRPEDKPQGYAIPYRLKFGNINNVLGNSLYDWDNLSPTGINSREIKVYDVSETVVGSAPAGVFEDTILVEIFSPN